MGKRILVLGSYVTDLTGRTNRLPGPGETIKGHYFKMGPGGKGSNQAVAAHRAGADVTLITRLGDDTLGKETIDFYKSENMQTDSIIIDKEHATGVALILVSEGDGQNQIIVIPSACERFTDAEIPEILKKVEQSDILLMQLEINMEPMVAAVKHAKENGVTTILNPAPAQQIDKEFLKYIDIIIPNETEAQFLTGMSVIDKSNVNQAGKKLFDLGINSVIITLGEEGCYACDGENERFFDIIKAGEVVETTGAGDAFCGGFAAALSKGYDFFDAVSYGNTVAGISVTRLGTAPSMPYSDEIEKFR